MNKNCRVQVAGCAATRAAIGLAAAIACLASGLATAQGRDMGCSPTVANPCTGGSGGSGGGGYTGPNLWDLFRNSGPSAAEQARAMNERGIEAYKKGDWASAAAHFEQALQKDPNDAVIRQNLANARANLDRHKAEQDALRRNKAAADNMQRAIQGVAQTLSVAPAAGGLDFVASNPKPGPALPSDDRIVDARNVPSGLPKATDDAISGAYANAPPGVSDRVRKGFQAVMDNDWNVAGAWFEDALRRDPGNASLKRLVLLSEYSLRDRAAASPAATVPVVSSATPAKVEIDEFFRNFREGRKFTPSDNVRRYVLGLPNEQFRDLLWNLKPQDSDLSYLYDLNLPRSVQGASSAR